MKPEGLLCLCPVATAERFFWHQSIHLFPKNIQATQNSLPDFVRCEGITIIDLKGMSASVMTSDALDCVKLASAVGNFFPEVS
jgi:hypothetical protein